MSLNDTPSNPPAAQDALLAQFARHYLAQQRSEQRWRWFWRAVWLTVALLALAGIWQGVPHSAQPQPHTALVEVRGPISVSDEANADRIMASLREAFEQPSARAVILRINSPGGSPVQAGIINDEIRRLKALHKKPVYAVCEEMCASAAYYIAVAADQIYVDKASIVGSVGVLMNGFGFVGLLDKLGIERRLMASGSNKGMLDPFSPRDLDQEGYAQQMLEQVHQQFITVVRQGRGKRLKEDDTTFSGLFWNGQQAVTMGLADRLGSLDQVARDVVKHEDIVDYTEHEDIAERLAKRFGAALGAGAVQSFERQTGWR
jgi:protease-4